VEDIYLPLERTYILVDIQWRLSGGQVESVWIPIYIIKRYIYLPLL
jgi:hypothetical protein